jgi:hypothetical protein
MFQIGVRSRSRLLEMCQWVEVQGLDMRDRDRLAEAAQSGQLPREPENIKKKGLPSRGGAMARARLRDDGQLDLNWSGGKAGTRR